MTTMLLIHGGGLGAWSWDLVRPLLNEAGHAVVAPDLPLGHATLREIAHEAASALGPDADDVVVVGHALGCAVVPLVAAEVGAAGMVWVCGIIPVPGSSCADQIRDDPSMVPMFEGGDYERGSAAQTVDHFAESLLHDCSPDVRRWAEPLIRAGHRAAGGVSAVSDPFPADIWPRVPTQYIVASDDRGLSPDWSRRAARDRLGVDPVELPGGHCPLLSRPDALVAALLGPDGVVACAVR